MIDKIMGFLTLKGWKGVQDVFTFVIVGTTLGMGLLYYFLIYQKEYKPPKLSVVQSYIVKIIVLVVVLIFILTLEKK